MATPFLGEIKIFSFTYAPKGWAQCNGQLLPISQNAALFSLLGTTFGGDGRTTFALPDLRGRVALGTGSNVTLGQVSGADPSGSFVSAITSITANRSLGTSTVGTLHVTSQIANNRQPALVLNVCIALQGIFPSRN